MLHQKSKIVNNGSKNLLCAHGWAGQTQLPYWWRISQSEIRNSVAAESEGGQKFLPPNPLPFCPPERSVSAARSAAISWSSVQKKVRASFSNRDQTRLLSFLGEEVCSAFAKATADRSLISLQVKYTKTGGRAKIH